MLASYITFNTCINKVLPQIKIGSILKGKFPKLGKICYKFWKESFENCFEITQKKQYLY